MMIWMVILAAGTMLALALFMAFVLGWANEAFHVDVDPKVEAVNEALPGANCGGCGYVGCNEYAEAVVAGQIPPDKCTVGGASCATALANILGIELGESYPYRPAVHCGATYEQRLKRHEYRGEQTCRTANLIAGVQGCTYGCMGFGDCTRVCAFDAIHIIDGLATVDYDACVGCGACERACPRHIISMVPFKSEQMLIVACSNQDFGKDVKAVCKVGCIGCKGCAKRSELFEVTDNIPRIDYDKYDPETMEAAQVAIEKCPMKRLTVVGKPTDKDLASLLEEEAPTIVQADFKTTVDETEWHG
jgi:Na+-translocating ferredoxin:NAD+ oxidoreductase subunit B